MNQAVVVRARQASTSVDAKACNARDRQQALLIQEAA